MDELCRGINPEVYNLLAPTAYAGWQRSLLQRLSWLGTRALQGKLDVFKTTQAAFPSSSSRRKTTQDELYRRFVSKHRDDALRSFAAEFPLFAWWCEALVKNWRSTVVEFLMRLATDQVALRSRFGSGQFIGQVVAIDAGLSDTHCRGRSVVRVTYQGGSTLIYKPRSVAPEVLFARGIDALNRAGSAQRLRAARSWDRGDYGWMENIAAVPCATLDEIHGFHWRAGALLGLAHFSRAVDFHRENLIVVGGSPVLIDLETLWHPQNHVGLAASTAASTSILRTGLLPHRSQRTGKSYPCGVPNLTSSGVGVRAGVLLDEIEAGYRWAGRQFYGPLFRWFQRWLRILMKSPRRRLLRTTAEYYSLLEGLTSPGLLRKKFEPSGIQAYLSERCSSLTPDELNALMQLDVPYIPQPTWSDVDEHADLEVGVLSEDVYLAQIPVIERSLTREV